MTGPKADATRAVPLLWTANSTTRMKIVSGTTKCSSAGVASLRPSTADSTEIAGVIMESPMNIEAPMTPSASNGQLLWRSARDGLAKRIERRCTDIAEHHADTSQRQGPKASRDRPVMGFG